MNVRVCVCVRDRMNVEKFREENSPLNSNLMKQTVTATATADKHFIKQLF